MSERTAQLIDEEVRALIERNYERARRMLTENIDTLHALAQALLKFETLSGEQLDDIMAGKALQVSEDHEDNPPGTSGKSAKDQNYSDDRPNSNVIGPPIGQQA